MGKKIMISLKYHFLPTKMAKLRKSGRRRKGHKVTESQTHCQQILKSVSPLQETVWYPPPTRRFLCHLRTGVLKQRAPKHLPRQPYHTLNFRTCCSLYLLGRGIGSPSLPPISDALLPLYNKEHHTSLSPILTMVYYIPWPENLLGPKEACDNYFNQSNQSVSLKHFQ